MSASITIASPPANEWHLRLWKPPDTFRIRCFCGFILEDIPPWNLHFNYWLFFLLYFYVVIEVLDWTLFK